MDYCDSGSDSDSNSNSDSNSGSDSDFFVRLFRFSLLETNHHHIKRAKCFEDLQHDKLRWLCSPSCPPEPVFVVKSDSDAKYCLDCNSNGSILLRSNGEYMSSSASECIKPQFDVPGEDLVGQLKQALESMIKHYVSYMELTAINENKVVCYVTKQKGFFNLREWKIATFAKVEKLYCQDGDVRAHLPGLGKSCREVQVVSNSWKDALGEEEARKWEVEFRELHSKMNELKSCKERMSSLKEENEKCKKKVAELTKENEHFLNKLNSLRDEKKDLLNEYNQNRTEMDKLKQERSELYEENQRLRGRLNELTLGPGIESSFPQVQHIIERYEAIGDQTRKECAKYIRTTLEKNSQLEKCEKSLLPRFAHCVSFCILLESYKFVKKWLEKQFETLQKIFCLPDQRAAQRNCQTIFQEQFERTFKNLEKEGVREVNKSWRKCVEKMEPPFGPLVKNLLKDREEVDIITKLVEECLYCMWLCALARPELQPFPLCFESRVNLQNKLRSYPVKPSFSKERYGSENGCKDIGYFVWPSLLRLDTQQWMLPIFVCYAVKSSVESQPSNIKKLNASEKQDKKNCAQEEENAPPRSSEE